MSSWWLALLGTRQIGQPITTTRYVLDCQRLLIWASTMQPSSLTGWLLAALVCVVKAPPAQGRDDSGSYCLSQVDEITLSGTTIQVHLDREVCGCRFELAFEGGPVEVVPPRYFASLQATQQALGSCHRVYEIELREAAPLAVRRRSTIIVREPLSTVLEYDPVLAQQ